MRTFDGWRAVGRAMRWARQQPDVAFSRTHRDRPVRLRWDGDFNRSVLVKLYNARNITVELGTEDSPWNAVGEFDAPTLLRILAALDLIPAELAEPSPRYGRCTRCGRIAEWAEPTRQFAGRWCHLRPERPFHVPEVQPPGQATGAIQLCRCPLTGPEHVRTRLCHTPGKPATTTEHDQ
jgi:hypothetical protein